MRRCLYHGGLFGNVMPIRSHISSSFKLLSPSSNKPQVVRRFMIFSLTVATEICCRSCGTRRLWQNLFQIEHERRKVGFSLFGYFLPSVSVVCRESNKYGPRQPLVL